MKLGKSFWNEQRLLRDERTAQQAELRDSMRRGEGVKVQVVGHPMIWLPRGGKGQFRVVLFTDQTVGFYRPTGYKQVARHSLATVEMAIHCGESGDLNGLRITA